MLVAEDSDGDSWLEVLEGSPGPSIQNSRILEPPAQEKLESPHAWAIDETWVSELGEYKHTEIHDESGKPKKQHDKNWISNESHKQRKTPDIQASMQSYFLHTPLLKIQVSSPIHVSV